MTFEEAKAVLQITVLAFTAASAFFLLRSFLALSAKAIVSLSTTYWNRNEPFLDNLIQQKVDTCVGFFFLILSIGGQMAHLASFQGIDSEYLRWYKYLLCFGVESIVFIGLGLRYSCCKRKNMRKEVDNLFAWRKAAACIVDVSREIQKQVKKG